MYVLWNMFHPKKTSLATLASIAALECAGWTFPRLLIFGSWMDGCEETRRQRVISTGRLTACPFCTDMTNGFCTYLACLKFNAKDRMQMQPYFFCRWVALQNSHEDQNVTIWKKNHDSFCNAMFWAAAVAVIFPACLLGSGWWAIGFNSGGGAHWGGFRWSHRVPTPRAGRIWRHPKNWKTFCQTMGLLILRRLNPVGTFGCLGMQPRISRYSAFLHPSVLWHLMRILRGMHGRQLMPRNWQVGFALRLGQLYMC